MFVSVASDLIVPERTRAIESFPLCGWIDVLMMRATTGAFGSGSMGRPSASRCGACAGDGNHFSIARTSAATPAPESAGRNENRDDLIVRALLAEIAFDLLERRLDPLEQLLHEMIVEVGHGFEQLAMHALGLAFDRCRHRLFAFGERSRSVVAGETERFHVREIDISRRSVSALPNGSCSATTCRPYALCNAASVSEKSAPGRSILLMTKMCGMRVDSK